MYRFNGRKKQYGARREPEVFRRRRGRGMVTAHGAAQAVFAAKCEGDNPIFAAETVDHRERTLFVPPKLGQSPRERLRGMKLSAVLVLAALAGCGGSGRPTIHGQVTFDGEPVEEGTISFEPADGIGPTTGGSIAGGKYQLSGEAAPVPGKKRVRISAGRRTGRSIPAGEPFPPDVMVEEIERYIPNVYNTRSTLNCEVNAKGPNQFDFDLKSQ